MTPYIGYFIVLLLFFLYIVGLITYNYIKLQYKHSALEIHHFGKTN